jgi:hypothetical protein
MRSGLGFAHFFIPSFLQCMPGRFRDLANAVDIILGDGIEGFRNCRIESGETVGGHVFLLGWCSMSGMPVIDSRSTGRAA